jgi:hypothetical protein
MWRSASSSSYLLGETCDVALKLGPGPGVIDTTSLAHIYKPLENTMRGHAMLQGIYTGILFGSFP